MSINLTHVLALTIIPLGLFFALIMFVLLVDKRRAQFAAKTVDNELAQKDVHFIHEM